MTTPPTPSEAEELLKGGSEGFGMWPTVHDQLSAAQEENRKLESALRERNREAVAATENYNRINTIRNAAQARLAVLREALEKIYDTEHHDECSIFDHTKEPCDCHQSIAREALSKLREVGEGENE